MFEIKLLLQAEIEMSESFDWYEEKQIGLGVRFYNEVDHYLSLIEQNPFLYPIRYAGELRTASLKVFPYLIIYWIHEETSMIYVTSTFNTSRNPLYL